MSPFSFLVAVMLTAFASIARGLLIGALPVARRLRMLAVLVGLILTPCAAMAVTVATPTFNPVAGTYTSVQVVTISSTTSGASIRYTIDGSTPSSTAGTVYSTPVSIGSTTTLKAIAYQSGSTSSAVASGVYTINLTAVAPTFSPTAGTYTSAQTVTITSTTSGASIRYTTDGSTPTATTGTVYSAPVGIGATATLKAIATKTGFTNSAVTSGTYTINLTAVAPTFSPAAGTYTSAQTVTITSTTSGASIRYTTDGSTPTTTTGTVYSVPVGIGATTTLKAIAYKSGVTNSAVTSGVYTINLPTAVAPIFSPVAGTYTSVQTVTVTSTTSGASIAFTTDGTTPTESGGTITHGTLYAAAVSINATTTLKALAFKTGSIDSTVTSGIFTINLPIAVAPSFSPIAGTYTSAQTVTITSTTTGASIRYTVDGSTPSSTVGTVYSSPVSIGSTATLKAVAYKTGLTNSPVSSGTYTINLPAAAPTFSPIAGTYTGAQIVTITSTTSGASIAYTTDGTTPTESGGTITHGTLYSAAVSIGATATLKAIAFKTGTADSAVTSGIYTINLPTAAAPTFSPIAGTYTGAQTVTIASTTSGASIAYTTDGTTPTESGGTITHGTLYSAAVSISATATLKAIAYKIGNADSAVTSGIYTINLPTAAAPTFSPIAGTYTGAQAVTITSTTSGASIRYTVDGSTPSATVGTVYSSPVSIGSTVTLKAITYKIGYNNSTVTSGAYTINVPVLTSLVDPTGVLGPQGQVSVAVTRASDGAPLANVSVTLAVTPGVSQISTSPGGTALTQVSVVTNSSGIAQGYVTFSGSVSDTLVASVQSGSSNISISIAIKPSPISLTGLRLWLRSTTGVSANGTGLVSTWADQSGGHNDASQLTSSWQPSVVANQINGLPAVHFTQNQQSSLSLPNLMAGAAGGEIFAVLRKTSTPNIVGLWAFGGSNGSRYPEYNGQMLDDFATDTWDGAAAAPFDLTAFHIYNVGGDAAGWSQAFNGKVYSSRTTNNVIFRTSPTIGDGQGCDFDGDIAEVIIYDHVLTAGQRDVVGQYLTGKYQPASIAVPAKPLLLAFLSDTTVDLNWSAANLSTLHAMATVERQMGAGTFATIATISDGASYTDLGLTLGQTYTYRVSLTGWAGTSPVSDPVTITTPTTASLPQTGLRLWLRGTVGVTANSTGLVSTWADQSGGHNDANQPASYWQPSVVANQINGLPAVHFTQNQQTSLNLPNLMAGAAGGEIFAVLRKTSTTNIVGLWAFGGSNGSRYPEYTGQMLDDFATDTWDGAVAAPIDLTAFHIYNVGGDAAGWSQGFNGKIYSSRTTNNVIFRTNPTIGDGQQCDFDGDIAEIIVYDHVLTAAQRVAVNAYFANKYMIVLQVAAPIFTPPPGAYASSQVVTIGSTTSGASIAYTTDGTTPTESGGAITHGTLYTVPVSVTATTTLEAIAYKAGLPDSAVTSGLYATNLPATAAPTFSPIAGTYASIQAVTISSSTSGASVAYTTDGTTPTESGGTITNGTLYTAAVSINTTTVLKALAYKAGNADSLVTSGTYTLNLPTTVPPTFSPGSGTYTSVQAVTIGSTTSGALIRYTTDGSTPTATSGTVYSAPVSVGTTVTLKAIAYKSGYADSAVSSSAYTINLPATAAPIFSPIAGTYTSIQAVTIGSTTNGSSIAYTTDGTTPTESGGTITHGTLYTTAVGINTTTVLKALAYKTGNADSLVTSGTYTLNLPAATAPTFNPIPGTYTSVQTVTIASTTSGALIAYTTDGTTPTESGGTITHGTLYTAAVSVSATTTLKAIAYKIGNADSAVTSGTYTLNLPTAVAPSFSPIAGTYTSAQTVTITSMTSGASIRYTVDGSTPSATVGTVYSSPVSIGSTATLKAITYKIGYNNSTVTSGAYTINVPVLTSLVDPTGVLGPQGQVSVAVTRASDGAPLANVSVTLAVTPGVSQISTSPGGTGLTQVSVVTSSSGIAQAYVTFSGSASDTLVASVQSGSSNISISIAIKPSPISLTGLRLWLRSTAGVSADGTGLVSTWTDQSNSHNDASQLTSSLQPSIVANQLNGLPAVHFTQNQQTSLSLPNLMSGASAGEVFAVLRRSSTTSIVGLWAFGGGAASRYPETTGQMLDDFASNRSDGAPSSPIDLTALHVYNVAGDSASWTQAFNGKTGYTRASNTVAFLAAPMIGNGSGCCFDGDIAEIIVYDHVLTSAQRDTVGQYLTAKYQPAGIAAPAKPTLYAAFVSSGAVDLNWVGANLGSVHAVATIQRQTGNGSFATIATLTDVTNYTDQSVAADQSYSYQVTLTGWSGTVTSDPVAIATPTNPSIPQTGLRLWLRSTAGVTASAAGAISNWADQSGSHNDANQGAVVNQPMLVNAQANGLPVVRFAQAQQTSMTLPNLMSGATGGEVFAVVRKTTTTNTVGLWTLGGSVGNAYPDSTGKIIEDFASNLGDGVAWVPVDLTEFHVYNVSGDATSWNQGFNGRIYFNRQFNTPSFSITPKLGIGQSFFDGDIAEIVMYDHVLTPVQRDAVNAYIAAKYLISLPVATPTFSPSGGVYTGVQSVAISSATAGVTIRYTLDGNTPSETYGIVYSGPITVNSAANIQAIAYKMGLADSLVASSSYTVTLPQASAPVFSLGGSSYTAPQSVSITCANSGVTILYTTDGSAPTETNGIVYTSPITISSTTVLKAIAYRSGIYADSSSASALYLFPGSRTGGLDLVASMPEGADGSMTANMYQASDGNIYITNPNTDRGAQYSIYKMAVGGAPVSWLSLPSDNALWTSPLIQGSDGSFYGVTSNGGKFNFGNIFRVTSAGLFTDLFDFNGTNGANPRASLVKGTDGNFYGTTPGGGASNDGTVFKVTAAGVLTTLVSFTGSNGFNPVAPLALGTDGNFYGTASCTTSGQPQIVFKITPAGILTTIAVFTSGVNGYSLVLGGDGNFYGITTPLRNQTGYGSIFRMTPGGTVTTLHPFGADSVNPAEIILGQDGLLYGIASTSADSSNYGSVFQMTLSGDYTTVATFNEVNGSWPLNIIQANDGTFYISTILVGSGWHDGVFRLTLPPMASVPNFTLAPGAYSGTQSVALTSSTAGASIAYTLDSSAPTESNGAVTHGALYSGPISVTQNATISAIAFKVGIADSMVVTGSYVINNSGSVAAPIYLPGAGIYAGSQSVVISSATAGASIAYTTDGSSPTENGGVLAHGSLYGNPIMVAGSETVKAIAFKSGSSDSAIIPALFTINAMMPSFSPDIMGSVYKNAQTVTITSGTIGASIAYTLDGTTPTEANGAITNGTSYTVPLILNSDGIILKAIAFKSGLGDSQVASTAYHFTVDAPAFNPYGALYYSSPQSVQLSTTTLGASIAYTLDGTTPIVSGGVITHGSLYQGSIRVDSNNAIFALGFAPGYANSAATTDRYIINLSLPVFTPSPRTYQSAQTVSIYSESPNALIAYTIDGSVPTVSGTIITHGTLYTAPLTIAANTTINTIAFASTSGVSGVASGSFVINSGSAPVATVTFLPAGGVYSSAQTVTMSSTTSGASVRYTTDGSSPTATSGILYAGPVLISASTSIKAIAVATGLPPSSINAAAYTIGAPQVAAPVFSVSDVNAHSVSIWSPTAGASIRYTLDGTAPTETNGTIYSAPIIITSQIVLKAIAFKSAFSDSPISGVTIGIPTVNITAPANGATIP